MDKWPDGKARNHPRPNEADLVEKMELIWDLRREERLTFRQIGEKLNISHGNARKWFGEAVKRKLQATPDEMAERVLAIQQIEEEEAATWDLFQGAFDENVKLKALTHLDKLRKSKRELLGLDAAQKFDLRHTQESEQDTEIRDLIAEFERRKAEHEAATRGPTRNGRSDG